MFLDLYKHICSATLCFSVFIETFKVVCGYRHEDGTVRFWDASGVALTPLYKLSTANVFHTDCDPSDDGQDPSDDPDPLQEEEWPPFRKVKTESENQLRTGACL